MPQMADRRINNGNRGDNVSMYSPQSVLHAMNKFQTAVGAMENSVLVPCRLQDIPDPVTGDLYAAFKLLSRTKVDLLFGDEDSQNGPTSPKYSSRRPAWNYGGQQQQTSNTLAVPKIGGSADSSDSEDGDVKAVETAQEAQVALDPAMLKLHANLNQNLKNLYTILEQMTDAANRVTNLYLEEVEDH
ncbi:hypothetical protein BV898_13552 [Hypsibius exemplaris]|uniref:Mid1-interacting protein 1A n=1 Tax=Hypsibius exemplaris TaxID=2072580 RepID=A0A1W0WAL3_HYPEX|nr:hypothetical protein BV898_13552 [Hypsibius exemplaris]